ncbi:MAG: hypothetical protein RQ745_13080, partial [Longimicrobiales bacterium]|nr:hypothetical protein [Longimicrobiales bacterium]
AWCRRLAEAGYPVRYCPDARVVHHGNQSAGQKPPAWRIHRTHAAKRIYLREHVGPIRGLVHRWIDVLGYALRAGVFSILGLVSRERRAMGARYRTILVEVLRSGHAALRPDRGGA